MKQITNQDQSGAVERLESRLQQLQRESKEIQFHSYLKRTAEQVSQQKKLLEALSADVERNYGIYQKRMEQAERSVPPIYAEAVRNGAVMREEDGGAQKGVSVEFKVGAGIFGVVGILFILASIMLFGVSYLQGNAGFLVTAGIVFLVNAGLLLLPVKRGRDVSNLAQLAGNTVITWVLALITIGDGITPLFILFYVISALIVADLIFRRLQKNAVSITLYSVCIGALGILYLLISSRTEHSLAPFGILIMVCLCFFLLEHKQWYQWMQYWFLCLMVLGYTAMESAAEPGRYPVWLMAGILVLFVLAKLLSRVRILGVSEIVITVVAAFLGIWYYGGPYGIWFLAAFLLSVFALHRYRLFYEIVITVMGAFYFIRHPFLVELTEGIWHYEIFLAGTVSVLLLAMLLFNLIRAWRPAGITVYNYCCIGCMAILYLTAFLCSNYVVYSILTLVGIITILVVLKERFGIRFRGNYPLLALFLVYMVFLLRIRIPVQTSILLMLIAVVSIAAGFFLRKKSSRVCGLVIAVFVCLKVVFYDFAGLQAMQRTLLFLVVGVIALLIALLYLLMEKRISES